MRIALVAQPFDKVLPPGQNSIGIIIYETAIRLSQNCHTTVYSKGNEYTKTQRVIQGVNYRFIPLASDAFLFPLLSRISKHLFPTDHFFSSSLYYFLYILQVALDLRLRQCDIVHLFNFSQYVSIIKFFNPTIKVLLEMQCEWLTQLDKPLIENRLSRVDLISGVSNHITNKIQARFPQYSSRCQTVFNGVDVDIAKYDYRIAKNETGTKPPDLLFVGRVSPEKGVHILIEAVQIVRRSFPKVRLAIIGAKGQLPFEYIVGLSDEDVVSELSFFYRQNSSYYDQLVAQVRQLKLETAISFLGKLPRKDLVRHYHAAKMLINPSLSESFGMTLVEAMAASTPVIATRIGGMTDIVVDGETGYLTDPGDASPLAEAIIHLLSHAELRTSMGKAARQRAIETFSWEQRAEDLLSRYRTIL
ncbi:MAG: glycosyltransferase family 4 protein [Thermodesulfobacteriota bacterium]|nr:glycosyltransferase family 4 protein [Thermodesulfobacteriota bacterium]